MFWSRLVKNYLISQSAVHVLGKKFTFGSIVLHQSVNEDLSWTLIKVSISVMGNMFLYSDIMEEMNM